MTDNPVPFVRYLEELRDREDHAALATLRRGLGKPPGASVEMLPYVVPWLPKNATSWEEEPYFIVAALFASHPKAGGAGTVGAALGRVFRETGSSSIERRFMALLNSHREDLPDRLRHAVALARSRDVPLDWHQLFRDLQGWGHPDRYVQRRWARDFWVEAGMHEEPRGVSRDEQEAYEDSEGG